MTAPDGDAALLGIWQQWTELEHDIEEHLDAEPKLVDPKHLGWQASLDGMNAELGCYETALATTPASGFAGLGVKLGYYQYMAKIHPELVVLSEGPILQSARADAERLAKCDAGDTDPPIPPAPGADPDQQLVDLSRAYFTQLLAIRKFQTKHKVASVVPPALEAEHSQLIERLQQIDRAIFKARPTGLRGILAKLDYIKDLAPTDPVIRDYCDEAVVRLYSDVEELMDPTVEEVLAAGANGADQALLDLWDRRRRIMREYDPVAVEADEVATCDPARNQKAAARLAELDAELLQIDRVIMSRPPAGPVGLAVKVELMMAEGMVRRTDWAIENDLIGQMAK